MSTWYWKWFFPMEFHYKFIWFLSEQRKWLHHFVWIFLHPEFFWFHYAGWKRANMNAFFSIKTNYILISWRLWSNCIKFMNLQLPYPFWAKYRYGLKIKFQLNFASRSFRNTSNHRLTPKFHFKFHQSIFLRFIYRFAENTSIPFGEPTTTMIIHI